MTVVKLITENLYETVIVFASNRYIQPNATVVTRTICYVAAGKTEVVTTISVILTSLVKPTPELTGKPCKTDAIETPKHAIPT